jgi:Rrf2 family protein
MGMKLSLRGEYALRALISLGEAMAGEIVPIHLVSEHQQIPKRFLEQILNDLRAGGFVESKRGIAGGYRLARAANTITLLEIVQHIEGVLGNTGSAKRPRLRPGAFEAQQSIDFYMAEVARSMSKMLEETTLADLCERTRQARSISEMPDYAI